MQGSSSTAKAAPVLAVFTASWCQPCSTLGWTNWHKAKLCKAAVPCMFLARSSPMKLDAYSTVSFHTTTAGFESSSEIACLRVLTKTEVVGSEQPFRNRLAGACATNMVDEGC